MTVTEWKTLGEAFIFSPRNPACVHNQQCTKFWIFIWYLKVTNTTLTAQARQKGLLHIFFSDGVSKLEDDETVTAKIASRDEAICPSMLTDRTFEPGGEKDMQGLKVGGGPVTTPSWRNPSCRFSNTILITRYSCRMEHLRPCISHCNSAGTSGSPSFHANESALHHIVPLTLHHWFLLLGLHKGCCLRSTIVQHFAGIYWEDTSCCCCCCSYTCCAYK